MRVVEELSDLLAFWFNNLTTTTIIPVFGNHDTWPVDQLLPESEVQRRMAKIWSKHGWIPHTEYEQFAKNGYYLLSNATARDGVSAVITNSLYYHVDNIFLNRSTDVGDQWSWLWSLPKNLTRDKLTLWTGHIVPGSGSVTANYTRGMERLAAHYYQQTDYLSSSYREPTLGSALTLPTSLVIPLLPLLPPPLPFLPLLLLPERGHG